MHKKDKVNAKLSPGELILEIKDMNNPEIKELIKRWLLKNPDGIINWLDKIYGK